MFLLRESARLRCVLTTLGLKKHSAHHERAYRSQHAALLVCTHGQTEPSCQDLEWVQTPRALSTLQAGEAVVLAEA